MKDISKRVSLACPICGNDQFESLDADQDELMEAEVSVKLKCSDCENIFSKEDLIKENAEKIDTVVEEVKQEAVKEFEKELKKALKKLKK